MGNEINFLNDVIARDSSELIEKQKALREANNRL